MPGVFNDEGLALMVKYQAQGMIAGTVRVGLFVDNTTPTKTDGLLSFTEPSFGGYLQINLSAPVPAGVSGEIAKEAFAPVAFTVTVVVTETVYGYLLIASDGVDDKLIGSERFAVPVAITFVGQTIIVFPTTSFQDRSTT